MAECCKDEVKEGKEGGNSPEDEELDALLDDALKDFSKPDIASSSSSVKKKSQQKDANKPSSNRKEFDDSAAPSEFDDLFSEESFAKIAEELSSAFQSLPAENLEILNGINKDVLDMTANQGSQPKPSLDENLEKAWSSLEQNIKDMKEERPDDMVDADFLDAMRGMGLDSAAGDPEGLMSMMQGMMTNLLSKDVLYPSLKEIQSKYPAWLSENKETISKEDLERFERQQDLVSRICVEFEHEKENDGEEIRKRRLDKVMDLMQQMQACGQPPFGTMGDDLDLDSGFPRPNIPNPDQCNVM